ncbi:hypothetical protein LY78DRAFT_53549 [Colletotrichum sublineola]|nr:hypothetical protein LY78DRAFT_53549 [Colletotrichum sublineola]
MAPADASRAPHCRNPRSRSTKTNLISALEKPERAKSSSVEGVASASWFFPSCRQRHYLHVHDDHLQQRLRIHARCEKSSIIPILAYLLIYFSGLATAPQARMSHQCTRYICPQPTDTMRRCTRAGIANA